MENMTENLRESFDRFVIVTDEMVTAAISAANNSGGQNARELQILQSAIGMEIVHELEYRDVCPLYLQYAGTIYAIDYKHTRVNIVRWIDMDDLEVMYRHKFKENMAGVN